MHFWMRASQDAAQYFMVMILSPSQIRCSERGLGLLQWSEPVSVDRCKVACYMLQLRIRSSPDILRASAGCTHLQVDALKLTPFLQPEGHGRGRTLKELSRQYLGAVIQAGRHSAM